MRTAPQRNTLIAASALGLVMVVGLVSQRRDSLRTGPADEQARLATVQLRLPGEVTEGSSASRSVPPTQITAPAPSANPAAMQPVVIGVVKPWVEIARRREYAHANSAERRAIRDLYWHECVEARIPFEQRALAYQQFVRNSDARESGASDPGRMTSPQQREQQAAVPSPVDTGTMRRWCQSP
jgi:hypothetical protein